jgi:hypothetical protein
VALSANNLYIVRCGWLAAIAFLACAAAPEQSALPDFDARRLQTGSYLYRTLVEGKDAGESRIQLRRREESGEFVFTNAVSGAFQQSWEAVCSRAFRPIFARLRTGAGTAARTVFELRYADRRVTGFAVSRGTASQPRAVDETVAGDTVDQRIDWAAVMALPEYTAGSAFAFHVFDPNTGNAPVSVRVLGFESLAVPAGNFETARIQYRIDKNLGPETYEVWVRRKTPRFLVRERFPDGAVTELSKREP